MSNPFIIKQINERMVRVELNMNEDDIVEFPTLNNIAYITVSCGDYNIYSLIDKDLNIINLNNSMIDKEIKQIINGVLKDNLIFIKLRGRPIHVYAKHNGILVDLVVSDGNRKQELTATRRQLEDLLSKYELHKSHADIDGIHYAYNFFKKV